MVNVYILFINLLLCQIHTSSQKAGTSSREEKQSVFISNTRRRPVRISNAAIVWMKDVLSSSSAVRLFSKGTRVAPFAQTIYMEQKQSLLNYLGKRGCIF